ncbi:GAF and ANTAR domain-containing protein [Blastococcus sp. MG754426]|uniref:GAF and ANTAR domain-containing protein n=1 Tax=unclassified Blastococcus TaxID=2619396 RepID=UPI001EEFED35|nr:MULTISPECIES: GAF and ANTAR domain-containing protein [unclassified Blastococcus]MCF6506677.1 GAF and ANTAR domain-containing protein [Blastococcus sp. MG754426]MCF6511489.1 GAF and ANTAR domain-containing protein [Blastococcus sp. MG754427]
MPERPDRAARSAHSDEPQRPVPFPGNGAVARGPAADLGEVMGQVARALQEEHGDVEATLQAITHAAVGSVPGAEESGITLVVDRRTVESRAPTGDLPRSIDRLQERLGEGPCLDALFEQRTVRIEDLREEDRWPRFAGEAADLGARSMLSFQLFVTGSTVGALNLYSSRPGAFGEESESVGLVFASHAAVALVSAQHEQHLRTALASRDLIGQAKGILMNQFKLTGDQAFQVLVRASSHTNRKLVDIAEELSETGVLPTPSRD